MAEQFVRSHTAPNVVVVFGKKGCPYCHMAVSCLEEYNLKPGHLQYVDFSGESNVEAIQQYFWETTKARTVSSLF